MKSLSVCVCVCVFLCGGLLAHGSDLKLMGGGRGVSDELGSLKQQGQLKTRHKHTHTHTNTLYIDIPLVLSGCCPCATPHMPVKLMITIVCPAWDCNTTGD